MEPSQPIIVENDGGDESNEDNGNAAEDNTRVYNFQNNPYIQSNLMNEENLMTQFVKDKHSYQRHFYTRYKWSTSNESRRYSFHLKN